MTTQSEHGAQPVENNVVNAGETPRDPMDMSQYSAEQLLEALTAAPIQQDAPTPTPTETETTQVDPAEEGKGKAIRVRLTALPQEQQVETLEALKLVQKGEAADILEALQKVRGVSANNVATAATVPEQEEPALKAATSDPITELEATLKELRAKRKEAKTELFDADLEDELTEQIEDTQRQIALEIARKELFSNQEQSRKEEFSTHYAAAVDELEANYPDVLDDNSEFTQLLAEKMDAAKLRKDPDLSDPRYILRKAAEVNALLNRSSGRAPSPPPAPALAKGTSVAAPRNASPRPTPDQVRMAIENASESELFDAIF